MDGPLTTQTYDATCRSKCSFIIIIGVARKKYINFLFICVDLEQTIVRQHMT